MKSALCLFLVLHLLLLSVLPCADGCLQLCLANQPTQVTADQHAHNTDRPTDDLCSPFCGCACCGTSMSQPPVFSFAFIVPQSVQQSVPMLASLSLPLVALPTWQPPQVS